MKPASFEYVAPETVGEALALLDDDSRPLAGGQSLVPLLNFRLARPGRLVDINGLAELDGILVTGDGALSIGAITRQCALERSELVGAGWPLLREVVPYVGHPPIRSRGTVGGSVAHADPAAELAVALLVLDASVSVRSASGERVIPMEEFLLGPLMTALEPDELLVEVRVPPAPAGARTAFVEYARVHGDFALGGVALLQAPGELRIGLLGVGPRPVVIASPELIDDVVADPWKRALIHSLVEDAIRRAS